MPILPQFQYFSAHSFPKTQGIICSFIKKSLKSLEIKQPILIERTNSYETHCKPIYRLGVTIENYQAVKAYRIYPPTDFAKWARICEYIIKHYNDGWGRLC